MPTVVGVDGTRDGWLAIDLSPDGTLVGEVFRNFGNLVQARPEASVIAVDIPIGAPTLSEYPRAADAHARIMIQGLKSSVFAVPPREALRAASYLEANEICRDHGVPGVSQQAWALAPKILEVEPYSADARVWEIHPEVSFAAIAGNALIHSKRTWRGFSERTALLKKQSLHPEAVTGDLGRASVDDVLDALAAAWSARRIAQGAAHSLPPHAEPTSAAIWY